MAEGHGRVRVRTGDIRVVGPLSTEALLLEVLGGGGSVAVNVTGSPRRRRAAPLQGIDHVTLQVAGPVSTQNNIVFLASGYLASQRSVFDTDVSTALEFIKLPSSTGFAEFGSSVALTRYVSMFNVFAVWQPSNGEGATRPNPPAPDVPVTVDNNLECRYGGVDGQPERMLSCNMELVESLATTAPCGASGKRNVVVVTIVNSGVYGGGGLYHERSDGSVRRQAAFFNGFLNTASTVSDAKQKWASLFFHEVGHALADLYDEYSFGTSSRGEPVKVPNCATSQQSPPWSSWLPLQPASDPYMSVSATPVAVCGYTDFFKPSADCIMEKLTATRVCPVCREASVLAMYSAGMEITYPRCPLEGEVVVLEPGQTVALYLNRRLMIAGEFAIQWNVGGGDVVGSNPWNTSLLVKACGSSCAPGELPEGTHVVNATVTDATSWVLPANRHAKMVSHAAFTIRVVQAGGTQTVFAVAGGGSSRNCTSTGDLIFDVLPENGPYNSYCSGAGVCNVEYKSSAYQQLGDIGTIASSLEGSVFGMIGGIVGGLLLVFLLVWCWMAKDSSQRAKCIYEEERPRYLKVIRYIMLGAAVVFMLLPCAAIVAGVILYSDLGAIGKILCYAALVFAVFMFIMAFVGFTSAYFLSKCALTFNGVLLAIAAKLATAFAIFAVIFHNTVDDPDSWAQKWLEDLWVLLAEKDDEMLCSLQQELECSGYHESCQRVRNPSFCPENCDQVHAQSYAGDACERIVKQAFEDHWITVVIIAFVLAVALWVGCVFNWMLRRSIGKYKKKVRAQTGLQKKKSTRRKASMRRGSGASGMKRTGSLPGRREPAVGVVAGAGDVVEEEGDSDNDELLCAIQSLPPVQKERLCKEFGSAAATHGGGLSRHHFRTLVQSAMLHSATPEEVAGVYGEAEEMTAEQFEKVVGGAAPRDASNAPPPLPVRDIGGELPPPDWGALQGRAVSIADVAAVEGAAASEPAFPIDMEQFARIVAEAPVEARSQAAEFVFGGNVPPTATASPPQQRSTTFDMLRGPAAPAPTEPISIEQFGRIEFEEAPRGRSPSPAPPSTPRPRRATVSGVHTYINHL
eukprot:TRINITY_DN4725_c0_g1_i1.p1 TRINITY_DN4725_c0_g1~~TRINITY_DN4725_c0_g1_i1.p1  ORF type:complete len:1183 (+),score=378.45 TRINITY_DN4725_c0_g1_i1:308-3550(+)